MLSSNDLILKIDSTKKASYCQIKSDIWGENPFCIASLMKCAEVAVSVTIDHKMFIPRVTHWAITVN